MPVTMAEVINARRYRGSTRSRARIMKIEVNSIDASPKDSRL